MTFADWEKRPVAENDAEAATVVMGWMQDDDGNWFVGCPSGAKDKKAGKDWSPCTDRNATDLVLAEVEKKREAVQRRFNLLCREAHISAGGSFTWLGTHRASPSLLTWAAVEACKGGAA